jgi:hypothetical protein
VNSYEIWWLYLDNRYFACQTPPPSHACIYAYPFFSFIVVGSDSSSPVCVGEYKPYPYHVFGSMAPVVPVEPNDNQALLMFDNARQDLEDNGWLTFVKRFEGFNLCVA